MTCEGKLRFRSCDLRGLMTEAGAILKSRHDFITGRAKKRLKNYLPCYKDSQTKYDVYRNVRFSQPSICVTKYFQKKIFFFPVTTQTFQGQECQKT